MLFLVTLYSAAQSGSCTVDGAGLSLYSLPSSSVHVIVAPTGKFRRAGQLELCANGAAHTCTAARDAASGISFACCTCVYQLRGDKVFPDKGSVLARLFLAPYLGVLRVRVRVWMYVHICVQTSVSQKRCSVTIHCIVCTYG